MYIIFSSSSFAERRLINQWANHIVWFSNPTTNHPHWHQKCIRIVPYLPNELVIWILDRSLVVCTALHNHYYYFVRRSIAVRTLISLWYYQVLLGWKTAHFLLEWKCQNRTKTIQNVIFRCYWIFFSLHLLRFHVEVGIYLLSKLFDVIVLAATLSQLSLASSSLLLWSLFSMSMVDCSSSISQSNDDFV